MIVELSSNIFSLVHGSFVHAIGMNWGSTIVVLFGSFFQGGVLIGIGKVLESIQNKR